MNAAILIITAVMAFDPAYDARLDTISETAMGGSSSVFRVRFATRDYVVYDKAAVAELNLLFAPQPKLDEKQKLAHARRIQKRLDVLMPPLIARGAARPLKPY